MMMHIRYSALLFWVGLGFYSPANGQAILSNMANNKDVDHFEIGLSDADDYGAQPYGKGNILFISNRNTAGNKALDPERNESFARPYLLNFKTLKTRDVRLPDFLAKQDYHIGICALLPDSSGIIASHSRKKPYKDGRVGMTLSYIPFNGEPVYELPFIDPEFDYQHPYFDPNDYSLYFASNVDGGAGGYDIYSASLSFEGTWSSPKAMSYINTKDNEVFPSVDQRFNLYFSRSSKNYGLQTFYQIAGDSSITEFNLNGRGDDFGLILLDDSTAVFSQSKRAGSSANLHLYKLDAAPKVEKVTLAAVETEDSTKTASEEKTLSASNTAKQANTASNISAPKSNSNSWVTDTSPVAGTKSGYSVIVGGFIERDLADNFLESIKGWSPEAFLARYNGKFYVVHSVHSSRNEADRAKEKVNNRDYRAWVLSKGLQNI